jgi:Transposase
VDVAIETDRGLLVAALPAAGHRVFAVNPQAVDRYRDRHAASGAQSDPGDAPVPAHLLRTHRDRHRPLPDDSEPGQAVGVVPTDDDPPTTRINDAAFQYIGTWQTSSGAAKFQGGDHYSDVVNNAYHVSFTGNQVKLYAATAPWHGTAAISIDGTPETAVDFYSPFRVDQALVYTSPILATGAHMITVRVTRAKNTNSTGTVVTADRADVITRHR